MVTTPKFTESETGIEQNIRVAIVSSYPPRKCGIGNFTRDLAQALNQLSTYPSVEIIALDNFLSENLEYPREVRLRIKQNAPNDYDRALRYLNQSSVDVVLIQHEFGIWGGVDGDRVMDFVKRLRKPCVVMFHTVLKHPSTHQREIMNYLCRRARAVVVLLQAAAELLRNEYIVDATKVTAIHHGVPNFTAETTEGVKSRLGLVGKTVMTSINLLSRAKGLEYAIKSLQGVVRAYPNFVYLVVGETHPVVLSEYSDVYRQSLEQLVKELNLHDNVKFINRYLSLPELVDYVQASDFYITPYLNQEQAASGSLAYALGAGRVCISTPYLYAKEMLRGGRGVLVPFRQPQAITKALFNLLSHENKRRQIERRALAQGKTMTWPRVALSFLNLFSSVLELPLEKPVVLVPPSLHFIRKLTTPFGILEHSHGSQPAQEFGYTVDDNAKALIVALAHNERNLIRRYLSFLIRAESHGYMYNDLNAEGEWVDKPSLGDSWAKAFWSLGLVIQAQPSRLLVQNAARLLAHMWPHLESLTELRMIAYVILGLAKLPMRLPQPLSIFNIKRTLDILAQRLIKSFDDNKEPGWLWFEDKLTYDNARLPQALFESAMVIPDQNFTVVASSTFDWLITQNTDLTKGCFSFIGCKGWYFKGQSKAQFDQQPVEAGAMVEACASAYQSTRDEKYRQFASQALAWYSGNNILYQSLLDPKSGGVFDGLTPQGINHDEGSESVLSYHLAYHAWQRMRMITSHSPSVAGRFTPLANPA